MTADGTALGDAAKALVFARAASVTPTSAVLQVESGVQLDEFTHFKAVTVSKAAMAAVSFDGDASGVELLQARVGSAHCFRIGADPAFRVAAKDGRFIQFEAAPGADVEAVAAKLRGEMAALPAVTNVQAEVIESRDAMVVASTIMLILSTAPKVIDEATAVINSIKQLLQASKGLGDAFVEIRGRRIPVAKLQASDISPAADPGTEAVS